MKKKEIINIELNIESLAFQGHAVARHEGMVYFVKNALPGDRVIATVKKKKKSYAEAVTKEVIEASVDRCEAPCKYFGVCGGCTLQNLIYDKQLYWKKIHVIEAFTRLAKVEVNEFYDTFPAPQIYNFRNKMEFSFGHSRWLNVDEIESNEDIQQKNFAMGLHIPGRYDKVLDVNKCLIQSEIANDIYKIVYDHALIYHPSAYDPHTKRGFLKNFVIRSTSSNDLMVILITGKPNSDEDVNFLYWYCNQFSELANINKNNINVIHALNDSSSPVAIGTIEYISNNDFITENILGVNYKISTFSFFQTNSYQLNYFIRLIIESADLCGNEIIWDLYCGTGSITLPISSHCKMVYGMELSESSISDAKQNAIINQIINVDFTCVDLHSKVIDEVLKSKEKPQVIIVDPPRAGMHQNLVDLLMMTGAKRIVYVSCNPTTQARDCMLLAEKYRVISVRPVDMFPQTFHVESIAILDLINYDL